MSMPIFWNISLLSAEFAQRVADVKFDLMKFQILISWKKKIRQQITCKLHVQWNLC